MTPPDTLKLLVADANLDYTNVRTLSVGGRAILVRNSASL